MDIEITNGGDKPLQYQNLLKELDINIDAQMKSMLSKYLDHLTLEDNGKQYKLEIVRVEEDEVIVKKKHND